MIVRRPLGGEVDECKETAGGRFRGKERYLEKKKDFCRKRKENQKISGNTKKKLQFKRVLSAYFL